MLFFVSVNSLSQTVQSAACAMKLVPMSHLSRACTRSCVQNAVTASRSASPAKHPSKQRLAQVSVTMATESWFIAKLHLCSSHADYIYIYIYIYTDMYIYIYIYIY